MFKNKTIDDMKCDIYIYKVFQYFIHLQKIIDINYMKLQGIILIMEDCYRQALKYEREVFQKYIDKCKLVYGM